MNYSIEHLKIAYYSGLAQLRFDQVLEQISRQGTEGDPGLVIPAGSEKPPSSVISDRDTLHRKSKGKKALPLEKRILEFLATKGPEGAHIKEIAEAIQSSYACVSVWLSQEGSRYFKTAQIKKLAPGRYCYYPKAEEP